jgi:hypothetical protein
MVIAIIHEHGVFAFEGENQPSILVHPYRPMTVQVALERVTLPAGQIHVAGCLRSIEASELQT